MSDLSPLLAEARRIAEEVRAKSPQEAALRARYSSRPDCHPHDCISRLECSHFGACLAPDGDSGGLDEWREVQKNNKTDPRAPRLAAALLALIPVVEKTYAARNMVCQDIGLQMKCDREMGDALAALPATLTEALKQ